MGSKLTSLSNQFVKDYEPLTKQLSSLVQSLNQRSQSSESDINDSTKKYLSTKSTRDYDDDDWISF